MSTPHIALVTGGSRGLGKNMALSLAHQGIDVLLTYHSQQAEAEAVVAEIRALGRRAAALRLDAGHVASFDGFFEQVKATLHDAFGATQFQLLINNAGTALHAAFADTTEAQFDEMVNVHFKGLIELLDTPVFRKRTAMYIGEKKLSILQGFLHGFHYATSTYAIMDEVEEPDFGRFHDWVAVYYGRVVDGQIDSVRGWKNIILEECEGNEELSVDVFFELYDKFRSEGRGNLSQFESPYFPQ